jgi:hypothetical protein
MKSKAYSVLGMAVILLSLAVFALYRQNRQLRAERDTYQGNTSALLSGIKRMKIDSATTAVDVKTLRLSLDEYRRYRAEDAAHIKRLGIELKRLELAARHELEIDAPLQAELKDTVVIRDTVTLLLKKIGMDTPYLKINGIIENNFLKGNVYLPVTLHQAVWIEPKHRFLWWRWGVKAVHQTISSDNPHVRIRYSEVMEIQK